MNGKKFLELKIPPPVVFAVFGVLMWALSRLAQAADFSLPANSVIALAIAGVGGVFAVPAIVSFLLARTTIHPHKPHETRKLIVTGVNAITRNPMYLGLLFVLIAWAIYLSNIVSFVPLPFFVVYLNRFQIGPEERALADRFGSEYEAYCTRVRRWL
jgi:protein-S-isoprenylcysteine O-methyltransferase Ste14